MSFTARRVRQIFQKIEDETPDIIFIKNSTEPHIDQSFFYLTGLESGIFEGSVLIAYPDGEARLYTSRLEEESAKEGSDRFKTTILQDPGDLEKHLKKLGSRSDTIGVDYQQLIYHDLLHLKRTLPDAKIIDVSEAIAYARLVKDKEEISRLSRAAEITSRVWETIIPMLKEGISEGEVKAQICYLIQREDSTLAFDPVVAFGANTAEPHYLRSDGLLKPGDFALFDFGARHRRYCADMTRTVVFGKVSDEQSRMYEAVVEANRIGIASMEVGAVAGEVHRKVSDTLASRGFGGRFTHSTGHAVGLSVHDGAKINGSSNLVLDEGMVFTVEPGVYVPGFGGVRIEDDVVVRKGGCETLTSSSRELVVL